MATSPLSRIPEQLVRPAEHPPADPPWRHRSRPGSRPGRRPGTGPPAFHGCTAASPTTKISGWPGTVRSGSTTTRPARSVSAPVASATIRPNARCLHAGRPEHRPRRDLCSVAVGASTARPPSSMSTTRVRVRTSTPSRSSCRWADRRPIRRIRRQDPVHRLDQHDPRLARPDRPEVAPERVVGDLAERARQLHARRTAADQHEGHPRPPPVRDRPRVRRPRRRSGSGAGSRSRPRSS